MFVNAIEKAATFTRPIYSISRNYGSTMVHPGAATIFLINPDGWALTCAHVARQLPMADQLSKNYRNFKKDLESGKGQMEEKQLRQYLEEKYKYSNQTTIELKNLFVGCVQGPFNIEVRIHSKFDIALIKFNSFERLLCDKFPIFIKDSSGLKQGKYLCRLGFPFPEFTNFYYDEVRDTIDWTVTGKSRTPRFPIEGMLTRHLSGGPGEIMGFEMSTPGLRGQSGGPVFDTEGKIWGMQFATAHLDLNFDIDQEVIRDGQPKHVQDSAFLHVGRCIHVDLLKSFIKSIMFIS